MMRSMEQGVTGLIAGGGRLPILEAEGIVAAGRRVMCVGFAGLYDESLPDLCQQFKAMSIARVGRWMGQLRKWGVEEAVMVGAVRRSDVNARHRIVQYMPDVRTIRLWYRVLRHDRRDQALLTAVADELHDAFGVRLIDTTKYIPQHLAEPGVLTKRNPTNAQLGDIEFAWPILHELNRMDIGQSLAVSEKSVLAVEAVEGTDAMIQRAGAMCRRGGWTLIKGAGVGKDLRFDVPTIGLQTIENLKAAGSSCLVVTAGRVILVDKPQLVEAADAAGIAIVAREPL